MNFAQFLRAWAGQLIPPSLSHVSWHGCESSALDEHDAGVAQRRAERDAQVIVPSAATNMLDCLSRDRDAFRHLTSFLSLPEMGMLAGSCSRVHRWLLEDSVQSRSAHLSQMDTASDWGSMMQRNWQIDNLAQCEWARRRVTQVLLVNRAVLHIPCDMRSHLAHRAKQLLRPALGVSLLAVMPWPTAKLWLHHADRWWTGFSQRLLIAISEHLAFQSTHHALRWLPRLERLQELTWFVDSMLEVAAVRACFSALGSTLQTLKVALFPTPYAVQARATLFSCISCLQSLRLLSVVGEISGAAVVDGPLPVHFGAAQQVDLSGLTQLKCLTEFIFRAVEVECFFPSPEQCACLARCDALTTLECGRWDAPELGSFDEFGQPFVIESEEAFLAQRIGVLAANKARTIFDDDAAAAALDQEPRVRVHALTHLTMTGREEITPHLWSHLCRITELDDLYPRVWSGQLTEEDWARLVGFSHLKRLRIGPDASFKRALPSVLLCSSLSSIGLSDVDLRGDDLPSLLRSLPNLTSLHLICCIVDSWDSLHNSRLVGLELRWLVDEEDTAVCARRMLADIALPRLRWLNIQDAEQLAENEVAALNSRICANCPLLRDFPQN